MAPELPAVQSACFPVSTHHGALARRRNSSSASETAGGLRIQGEGLNWAVCGHLPWSGFASPLFPVKGLW